MTPTAFCGEDANKAAHLRVALDHDVVDVRLECHADVLALPSIKLENVQHACNAHFEEHSSGAAAKLHDVPQLR